DGVDDLLLLEIDHAHSVVGLGLGLVGRIDLRRGPAQRQSFVRRDDDRKRWPDDAARHVTYRAHYLHRLHAEIEDGDRIWRRVVGVAGDSVLLLDLVVVRGNGDLAQRRAGQKA